MSERGTLEALIGELSTLLSPLASMTPASAPTYLAEVGLAVTPAQANQLAPAMTKTIDSLTRLVDLGFELEQAIEDEAWGSVIEKGVEAIDRIVKLIDGFDQLAGTLGGMNLPGAILNELPERVFSSLLYHWLARSPAVTELLQLAGLLEIVDHNVGLFDPAKPYYAQPIFHFDRIGGWLSDPAAQLGELYDWGKPGFTGKKLFAVVERIAAEAGLPVLYDPSISPATLDLIAVELVARPDLNPRGFALRLRERVRQSLVELRGASWKLAFGIDANVLEGTELVIQPGKLAVKTPEATTLSGKASATYSYLRPASDPLTLLAIAGGSKVTVEEVAASIVLGVGAGGKASLELGAELKRGHALITMENADGFLGTVLGGIKVESNFDLGFGFATDKGLYFHGSSALEIQLASHINLGPVELDRLTLSVGIEDGTFPVGLATDIKLSLGPLVAVVQGIGFELIFSLADGNTGNLGPIDLGAGFKPPTGVGLSIDAGVVRGGGFLLFDVDRGEYGGALQLDIAGIVSAKAIGVITTKNPDGSKGFSLIVIITAEFSPGFQLGYGFTLNGVGGLLGLNRTMNIDALREGVETNAIDHVMFPHDVVGNAPQIISDLRTLFPPEEGTFVIGPMAKLGWGTPTLISVAFGLVIAIPTDGSPPTIGILGVVKLALPTPEEALIKIQINIFGWLDFEKGMLGIDAALFDSKILFLTLEGSLAIRLKWKSPAGFLISIGGFHPSYQPPAELEVGAMKRLAINILNTDWARIRVEVYFALTSNTVQTGARAEIYFGFDGFYVDGHLAFDALFQFSPFYFEIGISASVTLHVIGIDVLSIKLAFNLAGPSPWHAWGTGTVTILFWDISADFDVTWGDSADTTLPDIDVLPILLGDLNDPAHWRALPPPAASNLWVALRQTEVTEGALVLHPAGKLQVTQKIAPLDLTWDKFGDYEPADIKRASFKSASSGEVPLAIEHVSDQFARSQFEELSDSEKLSLPEFEAMHHGAVLGPTSDALGGTGVERTIEYEQIIIDKERQKPRRMKPIRALHALHLAGTAKKQAPTSKATLLKLDPFPADKIVAAGEPYVVASQHDNSAHAPAFASEAMAREFLATAIANDPAVARELHVIPLFEVAA
jgi:hypothetical protein